MKDLFIKDLKTNETATFQAAVREKQSKDKKDGSSYMMIVLGDKTGTIDARMWDDLAQADGIEIDDVVKVQGPLSTYRDKLQLTVKKMRKCAADEIDDGDYLPSSERDREEMYSSLVEIIRDGILDDELRNLTLKLIQDHAIDLKKAPAAMKIHHAFVGGLLEHVLSLISLAMSVCDCYPSLDEGLLVAMCVIHDLGKIRELSVSRSITYSVEGTLLGHVGICMELLDQANAELNIDKMKMIKVKHMLLSHHGKLEYGALKLPSMPDAIAFSFIDDFDAKMQIVKQAFAEFEKDEGLTPWINSLGVQLYKG